MSLLERLAAFAGELTPGAAPSSSKEGRRHSADTLDNIQSVKDELSMALALEEEDSDDNGSGSAPEQ